MKKELTLNEIIEKMREYRDNGYETYIKGRGNGDVMVIAEIWEITNE